MSPGLPAIKLGDKYTRPLLLIITREVKKLRLERQAGMNTSAAPTALPERGSAPQDSFWKILHPVVLKVSEPRFRAGHYADAVEVEGDQRGRSGHSKGQDGERT